MDVNQGLGRTRSAPGRARLPLTRLPQPCRFSIVDAVHRAKCLLF